MQKIFLAGLLSLASVFSSLLFQEKVTPQMLTEKYNRGDIKILVVPGHDNDSYGAQYRGLTEANINAELGQYLYDFLRTDPKFEAYVTRKGTGEINDWISEYLNKESAEISDFRKEVKSATKTALKSGEIVRNVKVHHNPAADNTSLNLYGINKWANENNVDIVAHIHFNDYPGRTYDEPGEYSGFTIYVPESQLPNSRVSIAVANSVKKRFGALFKSSDFPKEKGGFIEDQQLIAVGANASREGASFLIEYGYIYEPQIINAETRSAMLQELAYQTYRGIKDYFQPASPPLLSYDTTLLPHHWGKSIDSSQDLRVFTYRERSADALSLQMALIKEKLYPPSGKEISDCPLSGFFGDCTKESLKLFQQKYGKNYIENLNRLYGK